MLMDITMIYCTFNLYQHVPSNVWVVINIWSEINCSTYIHVVQHAHIDDCTHKWHCTDGQTEVSYMYIVLQFVFIQMYDT